ncbi:ribonuclease H-like domain-containing protein [Tanacetum coccineum]
MSANDNFSLHDDEELSLHDDASLDGSVPASNKGDAPAKPPQIITTNTLSNIKLPVLQKDDYDTWAMEMEHYLEYIDNEVWKVIQNGNSKKRVTKGKDGVYRVLPSATQEEQFADEKERKARTLLLMAVPKDHLRRFHGMDDAKEIWAAIKTRFGGNANSKKMQKAVLKQQFEAFTISSKESLEKGYDRFQKLLSQLDALGAGVSDEDANHKFLRSLPPAWDSLAMTMRTKKNIDTLSIDDLYNNLSVFEQDIQKTSSSSLTSDNVAFLSQAKASSSKHKPSHSSGSYSSYTTSSSKATPTATPGLADEVIHSFLATNADDVDLIHEDLDQIDDLDLEEMDINWQIAMTAIKIKKFYKKTGRRPRVDGKMHVAFDKRKVECFNCHNTGHFARECKFKGSKEGIIDAGTNDTSKFTADHISGRVTKVSLFLLVSYSGLMQVPYVFSNLYINDCEWGEAWNCVNGKFHVYSILSSYVSVGEQGTVSDHSVRMTSTNIHSIEQLPESSYEALELKRYVIKAKCTFYWKIECFVVSLLSFKIADENRVSTMQVTSSDYCMTVQGFMLEFCGEKGIKQEFSNARTPQQNGVAKRMNRTLIKAARTILADSHLPTTFWAEAVNTACYTFNMREIGLGVRLFDLDYLTDSMNYIPVSVQNQANPAGLKEVIDIDVQSEEDADLMVVLLGVEKGDARSTWTWKRKCQLSLANWMQFGFSGFRRGLKLPRTTLKMGLQNNLMQPLILLLNITITEESVRWGGIPPLADALQEWGWDSFGSNLATALICLSMVNLNKCLDPTPSQSSVPANIFHLMSTNITTTPNLTHSVHHLLNHKGYVNKLRKKGIQSKETKDAQGQDQDVPSQTEQGDTFATPEKSKGSGEAQEEQISPSTLEAAQILTNVASEGFKGSQAPLEKDSQENKGKDPLMRRPSMLKFMHHKKSKELQELADLEEAQRVQAEMDVETQRQIDLDALLARRLVEQEEEAAREALATEFDYIQARLNADQILA